eukprot:SAG31_NODE_1147_length_9665_cov_10.571399_2_plen_91_part_00
MRGRGGGGLAPWQHRPGTAAALTGLVQLEPAPGINPELGLGNSRCMLTGGAALRSWLPAAVNDSAGRYHTDVPPTLLYDRVTIASPPLAT